MNIFYNNIIPKQSANLIIYYVELVSDLCNLRRQVKLARLELSNPHLVITLAFYNRIWLKRSDLLKAFQVVFYCSFQVCSIKCGGYGGGVRSRTCHRCYSLGAFLRNQSKTLFTVKCKSLPLCVYTVCISRLVQQTARFA